MILPGYYILAMAVPCVCEKKKGTYTFYLPSSKPNKKDATCDYMPQNFKSNIEQRR